MNFAQAFYIGAALFFTCMPTLGQSAQNQTKLWGASKAHHIHENISALKSAPDLPCMPNYSGQNQFLRGSMQTTNQGMTVYQVTLLIKDEAARVKQWYENALPSYKWKIVASGQRSITAKHEDGHLCSLVFNDATDPDYKSVLAVSYRQSMQR